MYRSETAGPAPESPGSEAPRLGLPIAPERLVSAVRGAKRAVLVAAVLGAVVGVVAAKTIAPREFKASGAFAYEAVPGATGEEARKLETLVGSVKLPNVLADAKQRLNIGAGIDELGKRVEVGSGEQSNLMTITGSANSPAAAKELTDAVIAAFLAHQTAVAEKRAKEVLELKRRETLSAKKRLEAARKAWDEFRKDNGVADPSTEAVAALAEIARLQTEGKLAAVDASAESAREKALKSVLKNVPGTVVLAARESRPALLRLAELQAEKKKLEGHLSPDHPKIGALAAEIDSLTPLALDPKAAVTAEKSLGQNPELGALSQGVHGAVAQQKAAEVRSTAIGAAVGDAQKHLARLLGLEGRASVLLADVRGAMTRLDDCQQQEANALDSLDNPQSGIRVVAPPLTPEKPSKTSRKTVALAAPALAAVVALLAALARALWGLRLVAPCEFAFWSRSPILASSTWPDGGAPDSLKKALVGATIVPFGAGESSLVERLVSRTGTTGRRTTKVVSSELAPEQLRAELRRAKRVVVVASAGPHSLFDLLSAPARFGRDDLEWVVVGVGPDLAKGRDRFVPERSR